MKGKSSDKFNDKILHQSKIMKFYLEDEEEKKIQKEINKVFKKINKTIQPSGISVEQMRVPIGVIGMIYESRPNVTIDAAGLSIKSGNSIILRGGSESINSNLALSSIIKESLRECKMPINMVSSVE